MRVNFTIPGKAKGKGRPRFIPKLNRAITPKDTVEYENLVRVYAQQALQGRMFDGPIFVSIVSVVQRPKSHYGSGKNADVLKKSSPAIPITKPDLDNIAKAVCDSMNAIAYHDDSQIAELLVSKVYCDKSVPPRVDVVVESMEVV